MKSKPTVSVIIPAFNEEERIQGTIRSVKRLDRIDELIVVDDGSRDRTAAIAGRYADRAAALTRGGGTNASRHRPLGDLHGGFVRSVVRRLR